MLKCYLWPYMTVLCFSVWMCFKLRETLWVGNSARDKKAWLNGARPFWPCFDCKPWLSQLMAWTIWAVRMQVVAWHSIHRDGPKRSAFGLRYLEIAWLDAKARLSYTLSHQDDKTKREEQRPCRHTKSLSTSPRLRRLALNIGMLRSTASFI